MCFLSYNDDFSRCFVILSTCNVMIVSDLIVNLLLIIDVNDTNDKEEEQRGASISPSIKQSEEEEDRLEVVDVV